LSSSLGFVYSILRWGNLNIDRDFARFFSWGVLKLLGLRVEVEGKEHLEKNQPCIYVANHQSGLDMATFGTIYPKRTIVIGKKEVVWTPFFGVFFVAAGNVLIDRKKTDKAIAGLKQTVEVIRKKKVSIWIFPEGTRNRTGNGILPLKRGAFHMAAQAEIPIVPLVSAPLYPRISWKEKRVTPGTLKIKVLPPIHTGGYGELEVDQLAQDTREKMLEALLGLAT
jgi:1-acyl-sn-glycerol-3-phosphate acyltransferase